MFSHSDRSPDGRTPVHSKQRARSVLNGKNKGGLGRLLNVIGNVTIDKSARVSN